MFLTSRGVSRGHVQGLAENVCRTSGIYLPHSEVFVGHSGKRVPLCHHLYKVKTLKIGSCLPILRDVQKQFLLLVF